MNMKNKPITDINELLDDIINISSKDVIEKTKAKLGSIPQIDDSQDSGAFEIVVLVSGGKDSQACLKLALCTGRKVLGLFCDTGWEHPKTYAHIEHLKNIYGVRIDTIKSGDVLELVRKYKRFPNHRTRFCTSKLKLNPARKYVIELARSQGSGVELWVGVRQDESAKRAVKYAGLIGDEVYAPNDFSKDWPKYAGDKLGISIRLPIVEWSTADVFGYLSGEENPLYAEGSVRVGCFPCLASGDAKKKADFSHDETGKKHFKLVQEIEQELGISVWTSKKGIAENANSGCSYCEI
jgi:3'-phosphoadenosine 5'-phosphosulfate sulfotransferase (PAPS reductase)/FAD synthetase